MTDRPLNIDPRWPIWFPEYIGFGTGYNKIDLVKVMGRQIRIRFVKIVINWITNQRNDHEKSSWAFKKILFRKRKIGNFRVVFDKIGLIFDENHLGYIDVGDGFWRRNVLMTPFECWWRFWPYGSLRSTFYMSQWHNIQKIEILSPTSDFYPITNIRSPTLSHQHHQSRSWFQAGIHAPKPHGARNKADFEDFSDKTKVLLK